MKLSLNILLDQLRNCNMEVHLSVPLTKSFCRPALLPHRYESMREDLLHICTLSDAIRANKDHPGMTYICVRNRIKDAAETEDSLNGMIIINENMEVPFLLNMVQEIFQRIDDWYCSLQDALIREKSLRYILDLCDEVIGNTINISDSAFTLLAHTGNIETDDKVSLDLREYGYHPESTLELFRREHSYENWDQAQPMFVNDSRTLSPYIMVNRIFRFRNTYFAHVVMLCDHHPFSEGLLELFGLLTDILAVYAERNWKNKNALSHNYDSFLTDLLNGTLTRSEDIEERAGYLGLSTGGKMILMKLMVSSGSEAALGRIARELGDLLPDAQILLYEQSVLALIHLSASENPLFFLRRDQIINFLKQQQAATGISDVFTNLKRLPDAWIQASMALKYGGPLRGTPMLQDPDLSSESEPLYFFQDRVLYGILGEHPGNAEIWQYSTCYRALHELWLGDRNHGTNNFQLLRVYLHNERKATETGQILHMHRNNVIYRIGKLEILMDLDLNDYNTRLGLEMSFLLMEIFGFPEMYD